MALLSLSSSALVPAVPAAAGPVCSLQHSGSLRQLGIEAQELTTVIGLLAEQLEADDDDARAQALGELEAGPRTGADAGPPLAGGPTSPPLGPGFLNIRQLQLLAGEDDSPARSVAETNPVVV
jgi:hypothetical protein